MKAVIKINYDVILFIIQVKDNIVISNSQKCKLGENGGIVIFMTKYTMSFEYWGTNVKVI